MYDLTLMKEHIDELNALVEKALTRNNEPAVMLQKESIAKRYNVSKAYIDNLMRKQIFQEEIHFSKPSGNPLFYVEACDKVMLPKLAKSA